MGETNSYRYVNTSAVYALGQDNPNFEWIYVNQTITGDTSSRYAYLPEPNTLYLVLYNAVIMGPSGADVVVSLKNLGVMNGTIYKTQNTTSAYIRFSTPTGRTFSVLKISS